MRHFSTADGDDIRVKCEREDRSFADDLSLTVRRRSTVQLIDGVLTSDAHGDDLHELFARGAAFRILLTPADARETTVFRNCTLLSSSGKWMTAKSDVE